MQEVVCAVCGAINQMVAHACWRCLEPIADRGVAAAEAIGADADPRPSHRVADPASCEVPLDREQNFS